MFWFDIVFSFPSVVASLACMAASTAGGRVTLSAGASVTASSSARNPDATLYVGGVESVITEAILWELFTQVGVVTNVYMPKDRVNNAHFGYGFVEMATPADAEYVRALPILLTVLWPVQCLGVSVWQGGRPICLSALPKPRLVSDIDNRAHTIQWLNFFI